MYITTLIDETGTSYSFLTRNKTQAKRVMRTWPKLITAYRSHDGDGWCDGSIDAWQVINQLPENVEVRIYA